MKKAAGFQVCLAHTLGMAMITQAKVKTDRRDAFSLAKLLRAGLIPKAYIYPVHTRPVRDLLRRRLQAVDLRAQQYASIRQLLLREGFLSSSRNEVKRAVEEDLKEWFSHPLVVLNASFQLQRIDLLSRQILELEQEILTLTKDLPDYKRLLQVPSLGKILALMIFYETGEISRFQNSRHFSSYCRLLLRFTPKRPNV
jgi:transposase